MLLTKKQINDPIYGTIRLTGLSMKFVDNRFFQRLRRLKQLGVCDAVFPSATHTRFEHSLGTYHLAGLQLDEVRKNSNRHHLTETLANIEELKEYFEEIKKIELDDMVIELIKIAALCHDIGHGPFSHIFDDHFIKESKLVDHPNAKHEDRSALLITMIVAEDVDLQKIFTQPIIKFVQNVINPQEYHIGWIYQIVSNRFNQLDVDKYDYITRDSYHMGLKSAFDYRRLIDGSIVLNDLICYPKQSPQDIYNLFTTRHNLYRKAYIHKACISFQYLIIDVMSILDKPLGITQSIEDMDRFLRMTDQYIVQMMENIILNPLNYHEILSDECLKKLEILSNMYNTHTLYPHIGTISNTQPFNGLDEKFNQNEYIIFKNKIGFVSGNKKNPMDNIYVYLTKDMINMPHHSIQPININKKDVSQLVPSYYQEYITMVFRRDCTKNKQQMICDKELFSNIMRENDMM